jgi:ABC-type oligopeptide transport system ATPase subunit
LRTGSQLVTVDDLHISFAGGGAFARTGKRRRTRAVSGVSFEIGEGETFGLVGESGSGKSTVGRALLRLLDIDHGHITFDGVDVSMWGKRPPLSFRRDVQAIFQDPASSLNPRHLVGEVLREPLLRHGQGSSRAERTRRVVELLDQVELASYHANRYPRELSGGQRQRVAIARALAVNPRFIVCDEIVSALDVSTQGAIVNLLRSLQRDLGVSYLFIAHDLGLVHHISDRIGVMEQGRLVEVGETSQVYRRPRHPYTRKLLEAEPLPNPALQRQKRQARGVSRTSG